ncbi:PREDICTED: uncharacterized protein LOC108575769 [Habropoda laboriosa]|uniref:uncharacterized protein LOC108575769 n=1 Tax=Habropoda laboriosa TaxID=597456 RepID=UPI00083E5D88|nr:PREDICTED: uncharacterized protein LOC108575769 [Habropoda laboriosa]
MGVDTEVTGILRDVVQFLECLREVKLPISLESIRDNLLIRSKNTLTTTFAVDRIASPEPYLNMNAAGPKGLIKATLKTEAELQEYVRAEEQSPQDGYYEAFQPNPIESSNGAAVQVQAQVLQAADNIRNKEDRVENTLVEIYASFTAAQTKSKCQICGSLIRKEGKKLFVFEQYRTCWVGLVGSHLLIYGNVRDNRPCTILPIRGYMARAAPNATPRDQRRSESTFEIFRPGNRTFQFVAQTPKDMEEWVRKICELEGGEKGEYKHDFPKIIPPPYLAPNTDIGQSNKEDRYQEVSSDNLSEQPSILPSNDKEDTTDARGDDISSKDALSSSPPPPPSPSFPPPLPARIPRTLPSLPLPPRSSYEFPDEEEDDIYHKIEDFRETMHYGNIDETSFQIRSDEDKSTKESTTYDDVRASIRNEIKFEERSKRKKDLARKSVGLQAEETYDDTVSKDNKVVDECDKFLPYDNIQSAVVSNAKVRETDKSDESTKSPQKKSFLDRVRSKRESPKKVEKKTKRKVAVPQSPPPPPPPSTVKSEEAPTYYDDVCDLINVQQETKRFEEEQSEYTCPPPPRPIYGKPPAIVDATDPQEFYDDVAAYRDKSADNGQTSKSDQKIFRNSNYLYDPVRMDATDRPVLCENIDYSQESFEDNEHYKTPRVESRFAKYLSDDQQAEDLYDDIAILADFTARQKEVTGKKDNEGVPRSQINLEKRSWNRFVTGKKSKVTAESVVSETNGRILKNGIDDLSDDLAEHHGSMRMNTFQKLFSRMENSLGKTSVRTASSMLSNKTNVTNNA